MGVIAFFNGKRHWFPLNGAFDRAIPASTLSRIVKEIPEPIYALEMFYVDDINSDAARKIMADRGYTA